MASRGIDEITEESIVHVPTEGIGKRTIKEHRYRMRHFTRFMYSRNLQDCPEIKPEMVLSHQY